MKEQSSNDFYRQLKDKKGVFPFSGQIELTYRCSLNCIHCYCKDITQIQDTQKQELTTAELKRILDELQSEGCIWLIFTGGDPLIREDFLELYAYAKGKGFMITLFTNALGFTKKIIDYLVKSPPYSIEITLNGITKDTYEAITQVEGSFLKAMKTVKLLAEKKLPLILKTNCLKQNKHQIAKIKSFAEKILGKPQGDRHRFKYDPMIYPRFNGDRTPAKFRLSFKELLEARRQDTDIYQEYRKDLQGVLPPLKREASFLYQCNSWKGYFFINPYGRLKFCIMSEKYSVDLRTTSFKEGFYELFPKVLKERFKTNSKCQNCRLRPICEWCPAKAYLETGDEEAPVPYYCRLAEETVKQIKLLNR